MLTNKKITTEGILSHLKTNITLSLFDSVDSTNTLLKKYALDSKSEGEVVIALSQTAGRGRYNRKFYSDEGGIYMSILLRPENIPSISILTAATAIAVSDAIEEISHKTSILNENTSLLHSSPLTDHDKKKLFNLFP